MLALTIIAIVVASITAAFYFFATLGGNEDERLLAVPGLVSLVLAIIVLAIWIAR